MNSPSMMFSIAREW